MIPQSPEWHDWRRNGIGGSDAPIIMGVSPYDTTLYDLWQEKALGITKKVMNPGMRRGINLEEKARQAFEEMTGIIVMPDCVVHEEHKWLRASLDGIDYTRQHMVEIKCPNKKDHALALEGKIPDHYFPQCQHQMLVTGLESMYYFSFDGEKGTVSKLERDQEYIEKKLLPSEQEFWNLVVSQKQPALCDKDFVDMSDSKKWEALVKEWKGIKSEIDRLTLSEQSLKEQLISLSENRSAEGHGTRLTKSFCQGAVDYKKALYAYVNELRSLFPHTVFPFPDLELFRKEGILKYVVRDMKEP